MTFEQLIWPLAMLAISAIISYLSRGRGKKDDQVDKLLERVAILEARQANPPDTQALREEMYEAQLEQAKQMATIVGQLTVLTQELEIIKALRPLIARLAKQI